MKDFQSFTADDPEEKSTKVHIEKIQIREHGDLILIRFLGSHFLWKMVRQVVGVIAEVGRGKLTIEQARAFLDRRSNQPAALTAPPSGLFLERVYYRNDKKLESLEPVLPINSEPNR
jgi:tRNA pseudouridine38-40 synthase